MHRYPVGSAVSNPMAAYKARRRLQKVDPLDKYQVVGYIAAGTYGRVYKAQTTDDSGVKVVAIKKFKVEKEGERTSYYTGISQSAYRELSLCRELRHDNIVGLVDTILEDKSIYLVFDYAEHDLLQIIQYHCHSDGKSIAPRCVKSILWQVLQGVSYLHANWVLHRDIKPANIMITAQGVVKVGDLGLARIFREPFQSLYSGDKVVVTIWYRAPELLLGSRHYTPAIDVWAIGCVFAEMLALRPIFKGEEAKMDKKVVPFQRNQMQKVIEILGTPNAKIWSEIANCPDYPSLMSMPMYPNRLSAWMRSVSNTDPQVLDLMGKLLNYNPNTRMEAAQAVDHPYFTTEPMTSMNAFEGMQVVYPARRVTAETNLKGPPHSQQQPAVSGDSGSLLKNKRSTSATIGNSRKKAKPVN